MIKKIPLHTAAVVALVTLLAVPVAQAVRDRSQENQGNFTEEEEIKELKVPPPAYPEDRNLIEFPVTPKSRNRYSIDGTTLTVGEDKIIRFVLVIDTPDRVRNVTFSGLRCKNKEWKDYAVGQSDRTWRVDETRQWRRIQEVNYNNYQATLFNEFFCEGGALKGYIAGKAETLVRNLKYPPEMDNHVPRRYNSRGATVF